MPSVFADARCIFFDCDGIIFDVNAAKTEAFRAALAGFPDAPVEALVRYHQQHGGISRYEKFRLFFTELHPTDRVEERVSEASERFSTLVRSAYGTLKPRAEALELARSCNNKPRHVVSGSDEQELREVFRKQRIASFFSGVHGSPTGKVEHVRRILAESNIGAAEAVFLGDGWGDFDACQRVGMPFVYLAEMSEWPDADMAWRETGFSWANTWHDVLHGSFRNHV